MNTSALASFVAAADTGSLSRAAARLGRQLSGISRHVAELETELGARLFERTGRGVRLTAPGQRFLERARQVLRELELARAEAKEGGHVEPPLFRISAPPDLAQHLLPGVLAELATRNPTLSLHCRSDVRRVSLVEESYDAVIRLGPLAPSDLLLRKLGAVTMRLYAPPGLGPANGRALATRELAVVEGLPESLPAREGRRAFRLTLAGRVRVSSFGEAAELAALTGRVVLLPSFSAVPFVFSGRLVALPRFSFAPVPMSLLRTPRHRGSQVLDELAQLLTRALAEAERASR